MAKRAVQPIHTPGLRVAVLSRKSALEGPGNLSMASQEREGRAWCEAHGHTVVWCDGDNEPASGITREVDLPKRREALGLYAAGQADLIWVTRLDRITREGWSVAVDLLRQGYRFWVHDRGQDTGLLPNPDDDLWGVIAFLADANAARELALGISTNVKRAKTAMREAGVWVTDPPYGTRVVGGAKFARKLEPNPDTWPVVRRIYEMAADGRSRADIAKTLTAEGLLSSEGKPWPRSTIDRIIMNPVYEGWQVTRAGSRHVAYVGADGTRVRVFAEDAETIPADLARQARQPLRHVAANGTPRTARLLTGLLRCAACSARMPSMGTSYVCCRYQDGRPCPAPAIVYAPALEAYVTERWESALINAADGSPLIREAHSRLRASQEPEEAEGLQAARGELEARETALQRLLDDRERGYYSGPLEDRFRRAHREALAAYDRAAARVAELETDTAPVDFAGAVIHAWTADGDRRALLRAAIDEIRVSKGKRGARFDGDSRVCITWAGEGDPA